MSLEYFFSKDQYILKDGNLKGIVTEANSLTAEIQLVSKVASGYYLENKKAIVSNCPNDYKNNTSLQKKWHFSDDIKHIETEPFFNIKESKSLMDKDIKNKQISYQTEGLEQLKEELKRASHYATCLQDSLNKISSIKLKVKSQFV